MTDGIRFICVKLASLFSGGKDSTFASYLMEQQGHCVEFLVCVIPADPFSWLFHTPNLHLLPLMARAMSRPLVTVDSTGSEEGDIASLRWALSDLPVDGVITGAVASDFQWDRINGVCEELGLRTFSPLWRKDQLMLLDETIQAGIRAIVVGAYAEGIGPEWLGREIDSAAVKDLVALSRRHGINPSGEGGEYETLVLNSPLHSSPIEVLDSQVERSPSGGRLTVTKARLGGRNDEAA